MKKNKTPLLIISLFLSLFLTGCVVTEQIEKGKETINKAKGVAENLDFSFSSSEGAHIVIVPGYGAPVKGSSGYEGYIEKVANFIENQDNKVNVLIFTGSYSSLEDTSEAQSMNDYFNSLIDTEEMASKIKVYKEECAIISWQNISNSKDLLTENNIENISKVTIFGDQAREEKLVAYATYKFNEEQSISKNENDSLNISLSYTDIDFKGYDFGTDENQQKALIAAEMAGAYEPTIGNEILATRIQEWSSTYSYDVADNLVSKGCAEFKGFR